MTCLGRERDGRMTAGSHVHQNATGAEKMLKMDIWLLIGGKSSWASGGESVELCVKFLEGIPRIRILGMMKNDFRSGVDRS